MLKSKTGPPRAAKSRDVYYLTKAVNFGKLSNLEPLLTFYLFVFIRFAENRLLEGKAESSLLSPVVADSFAHKSSWINLVLRVFRIGDQIMPGS